MDVQVLESLPKQSQTDARNFSDSNVDRALKNFAAAMATEDSLFDVESVAVTLRGGSGDPVCASTLVIRFREEKLLRSKTANFTFIQNISELLKRQESADSLRALLALQSSGTASTQEFVSSLSLEATGTSAEQAGLRWGLGLAHVQQAVLFASRLLRQQFTQGGD